MSELLYADQVYSQHAAYMASRAKFIFLLDSYHGGGGYEAGAYLDPHPRELKRDDATGEVLEVLEKYKDRQRRAYYPNVVKTVVDVPIQYVYQSNIRRSGSAQWMAFVKDCNGRGTPFNTMMEILSRYARLFGAMFFAIDKPRPDVPPETREEEMDPSLRPRIVPIFPSDIVDWCVIDGKLKWIKILERFETETDPFKPRKPAVRIRLWTETHWYLYAVDTAMDDVGNPYTGRPERLSFPRAKKGKTGEATPIDHGEHGLGVVPVVGVYAGSEPEFGEIYATTDVYQSAVINRRIYNLFSEFDEILRDQTFSILTLPVESPEQSATSVIGVSNGIVYKPTQAGLKPEYISPDGQCAETIMKAISLLRNEMYRAANLHFEEGALEVRSGVARAWRFDQTNRFLATVAKCGENAERSAGELVMRWTNKPGYKVTDSDVVVQYPGTFNIADIKEAIETADMILAMGLSKRFASLAAKDLVSKVFPNLPDVERNQIDTEIDASPNLDPPPIDDQSSTDAAKGGLRARVKAKRGRVKRLATSASSAA